MRPTVAVRPVAGLALAVVSATLAWVTVGASPANAAVPRDVVISEILYNPVSDLDTDDFLEIWNKGTTPVDISGWSFSGITLVFPAGTTIGAGSRIVVVADTLRAQAMYGVNSPFQYTGKLSNSGERINLRDAAAVVIDTVSLHDRCPVAGDT